MAWNKNKQEKKSWDNHARALFLGELIYLCAVKLAYLVPLILISVGYYYLFLAAFPLIRDVPVGIRRTIFGVVPAVLGYYGETIHATVFRPLYGGLWQKLLAGHEAFAASVANFYDFLMFQKKEKFWSLAFVTAIILLVVLGGIVFGLTAIANIVFGLSYYCFGIILIACLLYLCRSIQWFYIFVIRLLME